MNLEAEVVVVGAGPGGAMLGYLLAASGVSVILLERHPHTDKEFRGEHLNAQGEQILKEHGLYEKVQEAGLLLMEKVEYFQKGQVIKTILPGPGEEHTGIHVPQRHLLQVLIGESLKFSNYRLMMDTTVTDLIRGEDSEVIGVTVRHNGQEQTIRSRFVIGADGRYSTVRKLAGIKAQILKHGFDLLWARIPAPAGWPAAVRMALAQEAQLALFSQQGGFIQIGWNIEQDTFPKLRRSSEVTPFVDALIEAFPELEETVHQNIRSWNDFVLLKVQSCICDNWLQPGLIIMGDAAHTFSPTGAIGVNSAMQDAHVLAPLLLQILQKGQDEQVQLQYFEQLRRQETAEELRSQFDKESSFSSHFFA